MGQVRGSWLSQVSESQLDQVSRFLEGPIRSLTWVNSWGFSGGSIGHASLARENEVGGRRSIYSMLTYRTLFCFCL